MVKLFRWILSFLPTVLNFATNIFDVMTSPMVDVLEKSNIPKWVSSLLSPVLGLFGDVSIIGFMCGTGLSVFVIVGIVKFFTAD